LNIRGLGLCPKLDRNLDAAYDIDVRVLLVNSRLSDRGGADRWLLGVASRLQQEADTLLAVGYEDRALPEVERARVGRVVRVKGLDGRGLGGTPAATTAAFRRLIDEFDPDVVHANDTTDPGVLDVIAARGRGVQTVQDHRFFCPGRGKVDGRGRICTDPMGEICIDRCFDDAGYARTMIDLTQRRLAALRKMTRVTVLSRYMARELALSGVPAEKIERVPPFVDHLQAAAVADPARGEFHLMVGRLSAHKGVQVAMQAAGILRIELPLVIAGDGPMADEVQQEARRSGSRVRFVGWADRPALAELLRRARSLWLPSLWAEPFGIAGLEAMAHGVPVIASNAGGVSDWLVDGETGLLVEPGSAVGLAKAADRLAQDDVLSRTLGSTAKQHAAVHFDATAGIRQLFRVYGDVQRAAELATACA
jgi:glycosyltransferase involved in cell wall biosynthesis